MPIERRTRIWLGMGSWLLAGTGAVGLGMAGAAPLDAPAHGEAPALQVAQGGEKGHGGEAGHAAPAARQGGEGGEGGEAGALAGAGEHEAYIAQLLLIRGHLFVGKELYEAGRADDALPHYLHPLEEIYEELEPELAEHQAPRFKKELRALAEAVKAKQPAAEIARKQKAVLENVEAATRVIPAKERKSAGFAARVAVLVLKVATEEYEGAIENGRIANSVEYQDSRGFVAAGKAYLRRNEKALRAKDAQAYDSIVRAFTDLDKAYPSVVPPEKPLLTAGEFQAAASRLELQASRFH